MGFARVASVSSLSHVVVATDDNKQIHDPQNSQDENDVERPRQQQPQQQQQQQPQQLQHHQVQAMKDDSPRSHLKAKLKSLLAKYNGCTQNSDVVDVVNQLAAMNPSPRNCAQCDVFQGESYTLTAPTFPGRIKAQPKDGSSGQYTLGRLAFNIFQPHKLPCTLRSVRTLVQPTDRVTKDGQKIFSYHLVSDITIHTPDGQNLPATLINEAQCHESPDVNNRLEVSFTGGTLMPASELVNDASLLKLWSKTFEGAYEKADQERSYLGWCVHYVVKFLLGLTFPNDIDAAVTKNSFHFDMKRSPTGYFDVLYLDEDIRITRGNRGTIVVVERSSSCSIASSMPQ